MFSWTYSIVLDILGKHVIVRVHVSVSSRLRDLRARAQREPVVS